jgi:hypothetical protein
MSATAKIRAQLEQQYLDKVQEGKRIRKDNSQLDYLIKMFDKSPIWEYKEKVRIAATIGMTFNQVSKWNWDYRKKCGMSTERKKKPANKR